MSKQEKKTCFVIAPIGDEGTEIRRRSDQVLKHIMDPAARQCGYDEIIRADKISKPGMITPQIIKHLLEDHLVIADLSNHNPNVFYELAIRHAIRKPIVQLIEIGQTIPFDVSQNRTIRYDPRDWDSAERSKTELIEQIKSVEKNPSDVDNPISITMDLSSLRQSENPVAKSNAEIISMLQDIRTIVTQLSGKAPIPGYRWGERDPIDYLNDVVYRMYRNMFAHGGADEYDRFRAELARVLLEKFARESTTKQTSKTNEKKKTE